MLSIVVSTLAFFAASFFIKRRLEGMDIPKGVTRSTLVFALALAVAYGVAVLVDRIVA
jgi:VIT1/CCC1 family predicted Fe2+/Mn2+ transporter